MGDFVQLIHCVMWFRLGQFLNIIRYIFYILCIVCSTHSYICPYMEFESFYASHNALSVEYWVTSVQHKGVSVGWQHEEQAAP